MHCHLHASTTSGCALVYFTVQHCVEYSSAVSLFQIQDVQKQAWKHRWCSWYHSNFQSGGGLVAQSGWTLVTPWTVSCQVPLSMGFSRQENWSGLPCPPPGDLPNPGMEARSPAGQADSLPSQPRMSKIFLCPHLLNFSNLVVPTHVWVSEVWESESVSVHAETSLFRFFYHLSPL